jgi:hypothetical protein
VADTPARPPDVDPGPFWILIFRWQLLAVLLEAGVIVFLALAHPEIGSSATNTFYVAVAGALPILLLNLFLRVRELGEEIGQMAAEWLDSRERYREMIDGLPILKAGAEENADPDDDIWELIEHLEEERDSGEWERPERANLKLLGRIATGYALSGSVLTLIGVGTALVVLAGAASTTVTVALAGFAVLNLLVLLIVRELAELDVITSGGRARMVRARQEAGQ